MKWRRFLLVLPMLTALALPVRAGVFFNKSKPKTNPVERVAELIVTVKTDQDEHKRTNAAEELRQFDPAAHRDIVPVLIDVLMNDPKAGVRSEAAQSLGKLRPISQEAGWALEQAVAKDSSMRVRLQARSSLLLYQWAGYHGKKEPPPLIQTPEPPLAPPLGKGPAMNPVPAPPSPPKPGAPVLKPLPAGPPLAPAEPPKLQTPLSGPELIPPQ